jgi:hypothetical protein
MACNRGPFFISNQYSGLKRFAAITFVFFGCVLFTSDALAQYESEKDASIPLDKFYIQRKGPGLRKFLSKFTFGLSTGVGRTNFKHEITGLNVLFPPEPFSILTRKLSDLKAKRFTSP